MEKITMYIGKNRKVEVGDYIVRWLFGDDYKRSNDCSHLSIYNNNNTKDRLVDFYISKDGKSGLPLDISKEIINTTFIKLGINVELREKIIYKRGDETKVGAYYDYVEETDEHLVITGDGVKAVEYGEL